MNKNMLDKIKKDPGFIAALDQSGGSTPKALLNYGIKEDAYANEEEMFRLVHEMRKRIMRAKAFDGEKIIGAILFEVTMNSKVGDKYTADYLWEEKGVVPFLKIDVGLQDEKHGVRLMKPIPNLVERLNHAHTRNIFGTKMRSVIDEFNEDGITEIVEQQFDFARTIAGQGFVPIIEPEINIHMDHKKEAEEYLNECLLQEMEKWPKGMPVMFKLTLPEVDNLYDDLYRYEDVVRIVALSGGYSREESNERLSRNHRVVASFSRALTEGLHVDMSDEEFNQAIQNSIDSIYEASIK